jgi:hypothetical protein
MGRMGRMERMNRTERQGSRRDTMERNDTDNIMDGPSVTTTGATPDGGDEPRCPARRERRRCTLPRGRRAIGARWYSRGDWRNELSDFATGGVSRPVTDSPGEDWLRMTAAGAIGLVAGVVLAIGAIRLGFLPSSGPVPMVVAALAFAASGAFALVACCAEIDDATGESSRRD